MKVQGKQDSTVIPGNSQQHHKITREAFLRLISLSKQPVDSATCSRKQYDCDDRQQQSKYERAVHTVTEGVSNLVLASDQPSPEIDRVDLESQQCYGMLRDELILKSLFMRLFYASHPSQLDNEDIPSNVFFEWVGNAKISEKNLRNIQHFKALSKFNGINVKVLVDNPMTIAVTEAKMDTMTGMIETITVDQLYKDFHSALIETGCTNANEIFKEFVNRTELHRIGLCNQALRSDYFRLALMYTYGGMHSDIAAPMEDFDPKRGSVEWPLIPLKGKNGLLMRIHEVDMPLPTGAVQKITCPSNNLMASSRQSPMILSMLTYMLKQESILEKGNMSETSVKTISNQPYKINDHDMMRLYQCRKTHAIRFFTNFTLSLTRNALKHQLALELQTNIENIPNLLIELSINIAKPQIEQKCTEEISREDRLKRCSVRFFAVSKTLGGGGDAIKEFLGPNKLYKDGLTFVTESGFPFPKYAPTIANMQERRNMTNITIGGDGSWFGTIPNPKYVDDLQIKY
ncbi:hypothetical protein GCM10023116_37660 [Kistimonas scapharcae]|uniref:Uncharacterized protein n=1 Tax=Kistimonas scapharcae TaxID=1036133 RepID=A0ABP8V939_9GAMM